MTELFFTIVIACLPLYLIASSLITDIALFNDFRQKIISSTPAFMIGICSVLFILLLVLYTSGNTVVTGIFHVTPVGAVVLAMVVILSAVIMRFSHRYMMTEPCYPEFVKWLQNLVAAVIVTVIANHLLIFFAGWVAISLCLHRLLMLYPNRSRALIAARKKFIMARISEVLLAAAFISLYLATGTVYISEINANIVESSTLETSPLLIMSALCIAFAALLKCAQLPFHGWLIQIVEVPTPISALLHAGIINLGGYLLLVFSPLLNIHTAANWMLLVFAGLSLIFSSLIMTTRVTVKVKLAWSTSAQMSLMLIQCGLGLYGFALLHMVAHSLYKAYSFLSAGQTVQRSVANEFAGKQISGIGDWLNAALLALVITLTSFSVFSENEPLAPWFLLYLSLTCLLAVRFKHADQAHFYLWTGIALALALGYGFLKSVFAALIPVTTEITAGSAMDVWVMALLLLVFVSHLWLARPPSGKWTETIRAQLFGGLYLDEWFTRITLAIWPISTSPVRKKQTGKHIVTTSIRR